MKSHRLASIVIEILSHVIFRVYLRMTCPSTGTGYDSYGLQLYEVIDDG